MVESHQSLFLPRKTGNKHEGKQEGKEGQWEVTWAPCKIYALDSTTWQTYDVLKVAVCILGGNQQLSN